MDRVRGPRLSHRASPGFAASESAGSNRTISSVMLSRRPAIIGLREQLLRGNLGCGLRVERGRDRLVRHHLRQSVRTEQQAIASLHFERVGFDVDSELLAADDVRDDVAETVPGDLVWPKGSAAHHVGHQRVVLGELVQLAVSVQVRTAVAHVHDAQLRTQMERHRHRRPHAAQFRMLRRLLENAGVGLTERGLELREDLLRFGCYSRQRTT